MWQQMLPHSALVVLAVVVVVAVAVVVANTAATCLDSGNLRVSFRHKKHNWLHALSRSLSVCLPILLFASLALSLSPSISQPVCSAHTLSLSLSLYVALLPVCLCPRWNFVNNSSVYAATSPRLLPSSGISCSPEAAHGCALPLSLSHSPSLHACVKRHSIMAYLMRKFCLH